MPAPHSAPSQPVEAPTLTPVALLIQRRREEEKEQRRNSILDAAEQIISEKSWAETNFSEIAKLTRLSRSLIYVYFPTRHDLHHAICNRSASVLRTLFAEVLAAERTGLDQVEAIGRAYHRFALEFPVYFKLHAEHEGQGETNHEPNGYSHPAFTLLARALEKGIKDGSIRSSIQDVKTTSLTLWSFTHGLLLISSRKADFLKERMEIDAQSMIDNGFSLMRSMLTA